MRTLFIRRAIIGLVISFFYITNSSAGVNTWTTRGPQGGQFSTIRVDSTNPEIFYAAYSHSVFVSRNGGGRWNAGYDFSGQITDIQVDPTDGNRLYVAVLDQGLFRSDDGGRTFSLLTKPWEGIWAIGVGGPDAKTIYYSTPISVGRSDDQGATWVIHDANETIESFLVDRVNPDFVLATRGSYLDRSTDGGATWTETEPATGNWLYSITRLSNQELLMASSGGIYKSRDNGQTWSNVLSGYVKQVSAIPGAANTYVAAYSFGSVAETSDGGDIWTVLPGVPHMETVLGAVAGTSNGQTVIIAAANEGIERSLDGGQTWIRAPHGPVASGPVLLSGSSGSHIYAYTAGYSLYSARGESGWRLHDMYALNSLLNGNSPGQSAVAIDPRDSKTLYISPFAAGLMKSVDNGRTWTRIGNLDGKSVVLGFDMQHANNMFASVIAPFDSSSLTAKIYKSTDAGASWSPLSVDLPTTFVSTKLVVDSKDSSRLFSLGPEGFPGGMTGGLYRSTDGGVHWQETGFLGQNVWDVAIDPANHNIVYACTSTGLQVSTDGGATFTKNAAYAALTWVGPSSIAIDPEVPSTIYVSSNDPFAGMSGNQSSSTIYRSVDRGQTFEVLRSSTAVPAWYVGQVMLDPHKPSLLYATTGLHGVATFEIQNDLAVSIANHSGERKIGAGSSFNVAINNQGNLAATMVKVSVQMSPAMVSTSWNISNGACSRSLFSIECTIPVLQPNTSVSLQVNYKPVWRGRLDVSARLRAHEDDNNVWNNFATASAVATR